MKRAFWEAMAIGMVLTLVAMGIIGTVWLGDRMNYVYQTRMQMAYLADLSGYQIKEVIPKETQATASELTRFTKMTQGEVDYWVIFLGGRYTESYAGSYVHQLAKKYPDAISKAMKGDTTPAQQLEAKWLKDRHIGFSPFGLTLMLMFLSGLMITLAAAIQKASHYKPTTPAATAPTAPDE